MPFPYKNPLNAQLLSAPYSVPRNSVQGTDYSVLGIGGWMEVANLSDLSLTFSGFGLQTLSANTIPINLYIGNGTPFNPSYVNLNSDNFSSGRRRVGMIVYVNETGFAYQYEIDNYESLWNAATGATGTVTTNLYDTQVRNNSAAGQNFINAWTGSTIEGVSGTTREEARWRIFHGTDTFITGGTYFSGSSTIELYVNDGTTIPISGITASGGSSSGGFTGGTVSGATNFTGGLTANTISATTYLNLPPFTGDYLPLSGGTVSGATNFNGGLTANTISATTYQNLPNTTFTGGTVSGATNFTNGLTANTISATTLSLRNVANTFNGSFTNTNTADRVYTLPDAAGTIALTSNLTSYVPYTGASSNVNIGVYSYLGTKIQLGTPTLNSFGTYGISVKVASAEGLYIEGTASNAKILLQAVGMTGGNGQVELTTGLNNNGFLRLGLTYLRESSGFLAVSATNFAPTSTLHVRGASASDTNNAFLVQNSTPSALFSVSNTGTTTVRGISNTTGNAFLVQNLTGTTLFSVTNAGVSTFNPATGSGDALEITNNGYIKFPSMRFRGSGVGMVWTDNSYVQFFAVSNTLTTSKGAILQTGLSLTSLGSGFTSYYMSIQNTYNQILGGTLHGVEIKNTYSPSSSAGGIFRDLYIAPIISSGVTDWRGIEVVGSGTSVSTLIKLNNGTTDLFVVKGDNKIGFFGATPVVKQTLGEATASSSYTSTEQGMLQRVYDAIRTYGLGT